MKRVILKELCLRNFKGVRDLKISFSNETEIHGANGTGKTTIADAYFWLLYGKNSLDQSDFEIKTLTKQNEVINKLEHEVSGTFQVDGIDEVLTKIYKEKWQTKKGNDVEEMTGHETLYFINSVPVSATDYKAKVSSIIEETVSRIVTNLYFFNEKLKWQERRAVLSEMAGKISDALIIESITNGENPMDELVSLLNEGKSFDDEKKIIAVRKKKLKDEISQIPSRLDEITRFKPEAENWSELDSEMSAVEFEISETSKEIDGVNSSIEKSKNEILTKEQEKFNLQQKLNALINEEKSKLNSANLDKEQKNKELFHEIRNLTTKIETISMDISAATNRIQSLKNENAGLIEKFNSIKSQQFEMAAGSDCCPTCKRQLDNATEIQENLLSNFNKNKLDQQSQINEKGLGNKKTIEELEKKIETLEEEKKSLSQIHELKSNELNSLKESAQPVASEISETPEMVDLRNQIESITIPSLMAPSTEELRGKLSQLNDKKSAIQTRLAKRNQIESIENRVSDLEASKRTLSQELASLERIEFQIDKFNKSKIDLIENRINSKFKFVKFKMFEKQINGGETEACECLVDGVPYSSLNTASKVNASIDIVNAFQNHYQVFAPVIIDGRESVTNLIPTNCQLISLIVDPSCEIIKIVQG